MIIVLRKSATEAQINHILGAIRGWGMKPHLSRGSERSIVGVIGDETKIAGKPLEVMPGVENVMPVLKPYKLASMEARPERTKIVVPAVLPGGQKTVIGGKEIVVMAGPCAVESRASLLQIAAMVKKGGGAFLRAGAFKPRTSPYAFQGLGVEGLRYLAEARLRTGLPIITEVMDPRDVELIAEVADVIQIGARNMQNFNLLKAVGNTRKPVMIKRGLANTLDELLMSAEYVLSYGNANVILCERGIRTFEKFTRNTLDLSAVPVLKRESHLPVIVDPSHGTGHWDLVGPMARAAIAAGADGVMVEIHPDPEHAMSDGPQALLPKTYYRIMKEMAGIARVVGRSLTL